jgi:regulator of replication initiation timing
LTIGETLERIVAMKYLSMVAVLLFIFSGLSGCGRETKGLREEVKLLKEENSYLKAENAGLRKEIEQLYTKIEEKATPIQKIEKPEIGKPKK